MVSCEAFCQRLKSEGVEFFAGVPDSLLKEVCAYISDHADKDRHVITANEGAAVAMAAGVHLAGGGLGLVYLQNSGLGNVVNPLTSLTDSEVYAIPLLLLIGWRGEPGVADEPQHRKQGRVTLETLAALEIPYEILPSDDNAMAAVVARAASTAKRDSRPFALVVKKGTFAPYELKSKKADAFAVRREEAIKLVLDSLTADEVVVSTTGMTSREVFEHRVATKAGHARDFLTVGCMGHASQIAMGIALRKPERSVYCLDGDGAVLMHMGGLSTIGAIGVGNFKHVVINNGAHDSVGGQPTAALAIDLISIARACGYRWAESAISVSEIKDKLARLKQHAGPAMLEIRVNKGARKDLGRPTTSTHDNKRDFMAFLK